ncbi:ATPase family protein associated with various cellular activities (AAA) [Actinomadura pelletieri DSM 43383]|uniref:ATPase family protein associated with various cellular activities (AAA) n=2 Tax=Actinomadura pelletieri TaxID=111805 RepID=A0A495QGT2_9ACTN|nr:ATPase family protein associated with various cellular activities (AAA) [Actinomadura pelletieri DSM 43383]
MVAAAWWPSAPPQQRHHSIGGRLLALPDGTWWLFGAWARWYRLHPSDGQWYLCPPPRTPAVRMAARPAHQGSGRIPHLPPHVIPAGPDFAYDPPAGLPFVGHGFATEVTARVRSTVESAAALHAPDYPHWSPEFSSDTPSTVALAWGVMLWCSSAPAFDSRLDAQMLDLWKPYRAKPLPHVDGPRWLTPPPLEALVGLYAERLRASRVDAAVVVLRTMWAVASALRDDVRFQMRADALLAILSTTLANPTVDYGALPYGDQAIVQQWLTRCPPNLVPALRNESSPGDNFRHAFYTLSELVADLSGDPVDPAYIEPRLVAAALLAADLDVVRKDVAGSIVPWLDPEIRYTVQAVSEQQGHPLRRLWPQDMRLPEPLRSAAGSGPGAETLLAAMYELDLAWCRLGGMPARPRGFPVPTAIVAGIIGRNRARATAAAPTATPPPSPAPAQPAPFGMQSQPGLAPGTPPQPQGSPSEPDRPFVQPPAQPGWENAPGPRADDQMAGQGQQAAFAHPDPIIGGRQPAEEDRDEGSVAPPYTELGFQRPGAAPPAPMQSTPPPPQPPTPAVPEQQLGGYSPPEDDTPDGSVAPPYTQLGYQPAGAAPQMPQPPPNVPQPPAQPQAQAQPQPQAQPQAQPQPQAHAQPAPAPASFDPHATRMEGSGAPPVPPGPPGTRVLQPGDLEADDPAQPPPSAPGAAPPPGTKVMSKTMIGDFDFLDDTPAPEQPVHEIPPPRDRGERRVLERFGFGFVYGDHDVTDLLAELRRQVLERNAPVNDGIEATRVDGAPSSIKPAVPGVLLVGGPHSGQRRLSRMIALTLANAGLGDGSIRAHDAEDVRDAPAERIGRILAQPGPVILFERLDVAIRCAPDQGAVVGAVRRARRDPVNTTPVIATCEPQAYKQLLRDHPKLVQAFRVHRLPDFSDLDNRMTLLHLLAEERRVTIGASALEVAREDLNRLRGPGDLVNARLVEAYLDQAAQRNMERAGASHDRLVLTPDDLTGVAEGIEPALRPPGDIDGYLRQLDQLTGLEEVKDAVHELAEEAGLVADRARYGVSAGEGRHLIFVGPPGTGKTTVAGLIGGIYAALGLLASGHVVACRPVHLAGRDRVDTENRVASMVEQALGGVLLVQEAYRLDRSPAVVAELLRRMNAARGRFVVVCSSPAAEMEGFLAGNPTFRAEFGRTLEFTGMGDRDMVKLFQSYAERDLYMLDEELRVELLTRFERMRDDPQFAYARTVRALFEQTVARQAARLRGADVNAATVARLTARDLPETALEQMLGDFRPGTNGT